MANRAGAKQAVAEHAGTKQAVVCGAGGFIGTHLVRRLVADGYWVRGVDIARPQWSTTAANQFLQIDLRNPTAARSAFSLLNKEQPIEVYQLAADMGGMGFIGRAEAEILHNSALINLNVLQAAAEAGVDRYFLASSVCVYRDMAPGEAALSEQDAYPGAPDNEYGWEKLYAERSVAAFGREYGFQARIARFQNCYGPEGTWDGGREKAPAALCRKVAQALQARSNVVEVWGDGTAVRSFIYVDDLVAGIRLLTDSDQSEPTNIGTREYLTVADLLQQVAAVAGGAITPKWVPGPVGVQSRNFTNDKIEQLGFEPQHSLAQGLALTYPWIAEQVSATATDG